MSTWSSRWAGMLDELGPGATRRIDRGRALVRRGAVDQVDVTPGRITAQVSEDRNRPAAVRIVVPVVPEARWEEVGRATAGQLRTTAALLEGEVPEELAEGLEARGYRVVPTVGELDVTCSWREPDQPCRHVVAAIDAVGGRIAREPSLLLTLRGCDRSALLALVRGHQRPDASGTEDTVAALFADDPTRPRADLGAIAVHPTPPEDPASLLEHLGPPPGLDDPRSLIALVERAAATAWRLAAGEGPETADTEALLAELRARRVATAATLAAALGAEVDAVRATLDELFAEGTVLRTGQGERTRYRAAD